LVVNLLHDSLSPLNARIDQLVCPWASLRTSEQVVSGLHVQACENRSHDANYTLASLVHGGIIAASYFIRLTNLGHGGGVFMKTVNLSDAELTAYSGEHLLYELQLFLWTGKELGRGHEGVIRSVLIESFVIHLRNLIDFFFTPRSHDDDVIAADFCPPWSEGISAKLKEARERANKELSHLTLNRKSGLDPSKPWDVGGLFQEVHDVAKRFAANASPMKLSPKVPEWLNMFRSNAVALVSAMATTNTASTVITN
jgi:hypothetical protein